MSTARTFTELFARLKIADPEIHAAEAGLIARNQRRGDMLLIGLFFSAILVVGFFIEEIRIDNRNRRINNLENAAPPIPEPYTGRDSIIFKCTHCGWKHKLECE